MKLHLARFTFAALLLPAVSATPHLLAAPQSRPTTPIRLVDNVDNAGDPELEADITASKLTQTTVPPGTYRVVESTIPAQYHKLLKMYIDSHPSFSQGDVELLVFTDVVQRKPDFPKLRAQFEDALKTAGWDYQISGKEQEITFFTAVKKTPARQNIFGYWVPEKSGLMLVMEQVLVAGQDGAASTPPPATSDNPQASSGTSFQLGPKEIAVNVMKNAAPKLPAFQKLTPKPGYVRGWVKDAAGKPLAKAKIGVRATATGGFYSGASGLTDARGYYEIKVPWGAAHYYCAGYTANYASGRAALGLHPTDGDIESFPSGKGHVENWVLLNYGIADRDVASEKPWDGSNYYGGTVSVDYQVADPRPLFANDDYLPDGSQIEMTLTPVGKLLDGSTGRSFVVRKRVSQEAFNNFRVNNLPIGTYRISAKLLHEGKRAPLRIVETGPNASLPFGLEPKEARGEATLSFRPDGAKAETALPLRSNWSSLTLTLKR